MGRWNHKGCRGSAWSQITVVPLGSSPSTSVDVSNLTLAHDPNADPRAVLSLDITHPYRQKEVVLEVNRRLNGNRIVNAHDIHCVRVAHAIDKQLSYCYTQKFASARYSVPFVEWLIAQHTQSATFFSDAKTTFDVIRRTSAATAKCNASQIQFPDSAF